MKTHKTLRGFKIVKFKDYDGHACSLQESSLADRRCFWLGVDDSDAKIFPGDGTGWHDFDLPHNVECRTRMHLTVRMAKNVVAALNEFIGESRR